MAVYSMTGYGYVRRESPDAIVEVEVRTVNHRYFAWHFQAPAEWTFLEFPLQKRTLEVIRRGDVKVSVRARYQNPAWLELQLPEPVLQAVLEKLQALLQPWQALWPTHLNVDGLLRLPGLSGWTLRVEQVQAALTPVVQEAFESALQEACQFRRQEGARIAAVLDRELGVVVQVLDTLEEVWPEYQSQVRETWRRRIEQWFQTWPAVPESDRLWSEVALSLQKADVREEIDRLRFHVQAFREALLEWPCGRRLDFIVQELHREATTLAAKWQGPVHLDRLLQLKTAIDHLREQVQNVE
ncbi:MAG: DUF1732 domain-containing protein [Acidobacteria bacterium]|nr:DUF1732 domain-containing protein [Acidobacteriota bacterium]MDW7984092.1 DUF1732 domain-containing protein [Acidobacteriota bacterium]